ncbi:MAG: hypothetical protein ACI9WU_004338 [Myxococcota bacterium]|jgi:hypothetical protein
MIRFTLTVLSGSVAGSSRTVICSDFCESWTKKDCERPPLDHHTGHQRGVAGPVSVDVDDLQDLCALPDRYELNALAGDGDIASLLNHDVWHRLLTFLGFGIWLWLRQLSGGRQSRTTRCVAGSVQDWMSWPETTHARCTGRDEDA